MLTESICSGKWNCHFNQSKRQQKPHLTHCWLDGRVQIFSITFPSRGHALEQKRCHAKQRTPTLSLKPWHTGVGYFGYDQIISCLHWSFYVLILTKNGYILIRNMYLPNTSLFWLLIVLPGERLWRLFFHILKRHHFSGNGSFEGISTISFLHSYLIFPMFLTSSQCSHSHRMRHISYANNI